MPLYIVKFMTPSRFMRREGRRGRRKRVRLIVRWLLVLDRYRGGGGIGKGSCGRRWRCRGWGTNGGGEYEIVEVHRIRLRGSRSINRLSQFRNARRSSSFLLSQTVESRKQTLVLVGIQNAEQSKKHQRTVLAVLVLCASSSWPSFAK